MPLAKKLAAMQEIKPPKVRKQLKIFIGIINSYRYTWKGRAERLASLTKLYSKNQPWKWTDTEQKAFEDIKTTAAKNTLLIHPDFISPLKYILIQVNISWVQLSAKEPCPLHSFQGH
eukprot:12280643-Ditylum_brightwellii.AAC.1